MLTRRLGGYLVYIPTVAMIVVACASHAIPAPSSPAETKTTQTIAPSPSEIPLIVSSTQPPTMVNLSTPIAESTLGVGTRTRPPPLEIYKGLRNLALGFSPEKIGLTPDPDSKAPFGILMEFVISNTPATVTSFSSGDASIYLGSCRGFIGGIGVDSINSAAKRFVIVAKVHVSNMRTVTAYPLPVSDRVQFYVLTPQGIFWADANEDKLENRQDEYWPL